MKKGHQPQSTRNLLSLFSGALGLDIGLHLAGFRPKLALEIDRHAVDTINLNRPRLPVINKPIEEVSADEILGRARLNREEVTVISAGPCCQSFSTVGTRQSLSDPRGSLFRHFCRIVSEIQPRFFVMENVKGILSAAVQHRPLNLRGAGHPPLSEYELLGSALRVVVEELAALKYYVVFGLLNAADYGVPQKRWRVFFIGSRDGEHISIPAPSHYDPATGPVHPSQRFRWLTLRHALKGVRARRWCEFSDERSELLELLESGQNWRDLPRRLHRKALGAALDSWGGRSGFCRRLDWDEPSPTLTTAPDGRATMLCHPNRVRPLSIEEYAAIQQFPRKWRFSGSVRNQYRQIGNAVPVGLGKAVGQMLISAMAETNRNGITQEMTQRRGQVVCGDPNLERRLKNRNKTQLHPPRLRKVQDPEAARKWLLASAGQQELEFAERREELGKENIPAQRTRIAVAK
jgi:DNA (cytosine-5)-methyltransferase 1